MRPLLLREALRSLESVRGYSIRMAALNECPDLVRPHLVSLSAASQALSMMSELTNVDEQVLADRLSQQALGEGRKRVVRLGTASIGNRACRWQERLVCPACIQRGEFSNVLWELEACAACVRHRLLLTDRCNACDRNLLWATAPLDRCSCGQPLSALERKTAPDHEVLLSRHLQSSALHSLGEMAGLRTPAPIYEPPVQLDSLLLFMEFALDTLMPASNVAPVDEQQANVLLRTARKRVAAAIGERNARMVMCGRFSELAGPIVLNGRHVSDRSLVELKWMFSGIEPPDDYPLREYMASRRQRWQGIAPALVVAEPRDWSWA